jgi:hypothetical protein
VVALAKAVETAKFFPDKHADVHRRFMNLHFLSRDADSKELALLQSAGRAVMLTGARAHGCRQTVDFVPLK